ncbi:MAG: LssY C-terminal domain-containing protein [Acidobacteriia bacterium]|nr:LssY C-terminal domain-containing protein [Terriglobia bacterium]
MSRRIFLPATAVFCLLIFSQPMLAQTNWGANPAAPTASQAAPAASASATATSPMPGATAAAGKTYEFDVPATTLWLDTKIDLLGGAQMQFTASGTGTYPSVDSQGQSKTQTFGAGGLARGWRDLIHQYPVANSGHGALIGRIGSGDGSQPFAIGQSQNTDIPVPGRLFLGINQGMKEAATAQGSFHVTIAVLSAGTGSAGAPFLPDTPVGSVTTDLLGKIPRRVSDPSGNPGDMVNVLIVGSQDEVTAVFKAAGWVQVDRSVSGTILTGALATLSKEAYLTMPMSELFLFNRGQDYGFAHAEPVKVVESRNHLRAWKSPYEAGGRPVWCIAATHDIGFERDQRNNGLTHKIDPAIDGEREYVNETLSGTGLVVQRTHLAPPGALTTAKTATGGEFHSDGRILILVLKDTASGTN